MVFMMLVNGDEEDWLVVTKVTWLDDMTFPS